MECREGPRVTAGVFLRRITPIGNPLPKYYTDNMKRLLIFMLLISVLALPGCQVVLTQSTPSPAPTIILGNTIEAQVVRVVDGDTIIVDIGGQEYRVRYIGIDTPETVHPTKPVEPFGKEASEMNKQLVEGKFVRLEKDISETDRYDRLLRYVYVDDIFVNAELVRLGYAQVTSYPPDVKYQDLFLELQREAQETNKGLWGE
jgi:micrococcal nuclease